MAANFGAGATDVGEMATAASPRAGATKNPVFIEAVSKTVSNVGDMLKANKAAQNQSAISNFAKQQLLVADSVAQGKRSSAFAQTVLRQNLIKAIDSNPMMANDFLKTQSSIMGLSGGGKVAADGTKEEQRQIARKDQLVGAGLVSASASESEFARADEAARVAVAASEKHKQRMDTIDTELKLNTLTSSRRAELQEQKKEATNTLVSESAPAELLSLRGTYNEIISSNMSEAEKITRIKEVYTTWQAETAATLGNAESSMKSTLETAFNRLEADAIARASNEFGDAELERRNKRTIAVQEALALANSDIASLAVAQKLFGQEGITSLLLNDRSTKALNTYMEFMAGGDSSNSVETPSFYTDETATKNAMKQYLDDIASGATSGDEEKIASASLHISNLMESIEDDAGRIRRDPKKAIALVDWMASPAFLKARMASPEAFTNLEQVATTLETNYHEEVEGMIATEFKKSKVFVRSATPTRSGRIAQATDELVEAVGVDGGMTFQAIDSDSPDARKEAQRLNKVLKPIINNSLKAQAHLAGRSDYKAIWEESSESIFGGEGDGELAGGDAGDDLTTEDFIFPQAETKALPKAVAEDNEFLSAVEELAAKHEVDPSVFLAVMDFETGGSFDPAQKNAAGSSGTGLIQFMAATAKGMGTSTANLSGMSRLEQMKWVDKYFDQHASKIRGGDASDVYMSVLYPKAAGKPDDYVLFRKGTKAYTQNAGLDKSGDGTVTKKEAAAKVVSLVSKYKKGS